MHSENKNLETQQLKLLKSLQNRWDIQNKTLTALTQEFEKNRQARKSIWISRREELFEKLDLMGNNLELMSQQFESYRPGQIDFAQKVQGEIGVVVDNQIDIKDKVNNMGLIVGDKVKGIGRVVKRLGDKVENMQVEKILELLGEIKDML